MIRPPTGTPEGPGRTLWFVRLRAPDAVDELAAWADAQRDTHYRRALGSRRRPLFDAVVDLPRGELDVQGPVIVDPAASLVLDTSPVLVGVDPEHEGMAIRSYVFLRRNPSLSWQGFNDYWRQQHGPLVMRTGGVTSRMVRYVQHQLVDGPRPSRGDLSPTPVDGIAEAWFPDRESMRALFADPERLAVVAPDEERLLDITDSPAVLTAD